MTTRRPISAGRRGDVALGAEDVGVEVGDPLPPARGDVEVADRGLDVRRDAVPVELRVLVDEIGRVVVAELAVEPGLLELVVERVGLADVVRVAELADQVGGAEQARLLVDLARPRPARCSGKRVPFDRAGDPRRVEKLEVLEAVQDEELAAVDVMGQQRRVRCAALAASPSRSAGVDDELVVVVGREEAADIADVVGEAGDDDMGIVGRGHVGLERAARA